MVLNKEFSEDKLIEQTAIEIFHSLGYDYLNCYEEKFGKEGDLGRETRSEVILILRLKEFLRKLNPTLSEEDLENAINILLKDRSILNPVNASKEIYNLIKDGINIRVKKEDRIESIERVKVIDFDNPEKNDFLLVYNAKALYLVKLIILSIYYINILLYKQSYYPFK